MMQSWLWSIDPVMLFFVVAVFEAFKQQKKLQNELKSKGANIADHINVSIYICIA